MWGQIAIQDTEFTKLGVTVSLVFFTKQFIIFILLDTRIYNMNLNILLAK